VELARTMTFGVALGAETAWSALYLACFAAAFFPLALRAMRRRLIH
jgi:hypothetical protein